MTIDEKLDLILFKLEDNDAMFENIDTRLDSMDARFNNIDTRLDNIDVRLNAVETDVKDIKLTLENEIRVNIQRVAEGHLDLARNLHDAMKPNNEVEILAIKVRMLETKVQELDQKIS